MARRFRPRKGPTVTALFLLSVLMGLGVWQVQRLAWKTDLLNIVHTRMAAKPAPLPEKIADPALWDYRRVTIVGTYMYDHEFLVRPRVLEGRVGAHMLVPLKRASGGVVFVDRGWISDDLLKKASRPKGIVPVEGIVQVPKKHGFTPANNPAKDAWYWTDVRAMAAAAHIKDPLPVVVSVAARLPGIYPAGGQVRLDIPNDHRQYAVFWFGMALVLGVVYALSSLVED